MAVCLLVYPEIVSKDGRRDGRPVAGVPRQVAREEGRFMFGKGR